MVVGQEAKRFVADSTVAGRAPGGIIVHSTTPHVAILTYMSHRACFYAHQFGFLSSQRHVGCAPS